MARNSRPVAALLGALLLATACGGRMAPAGSGTERARTVTIYHTINGRRTEKKRTNMKVASNVWHTIRADFAANHFTVTCDGKKAIEWDDTTFGAAGKVGVWTKADSVTLFDDFSYGAK